MKSFAWLGAQKGTHLEQAKPEAGRVSKTDQHLKAGG
jgi:hypothetical protein